MKKLQTYSLSEKILNFTTHGFGVLMGLAVFILGDICHMTATWKMLQMFL